MNETKMSNVTVYISTPLLDDAEQEKEYQVESMLHLMETLFYENEKMENMVLNDGYIANYIKIFINEDELEDEYSSFDEIELNDGDEVSIFTAIAGGKDKAVSGMPKEVSKKPDDKLKENGQQESGKCLYEFCSEIMEKRDNNELSFHQRRDQRLPISIVTRMLNELSTTEVNEIISQYKGIFTPSMLTGRNGRSGAKNKYVKKLNPENKAEVIKAILKNKYRSYRGTVDTINLNFQIDSQETFDNLTALQTAKFIMGYSAAYLDQIVDNFDLDYFKSKMKKLIFRDNDDRAKKALDRLKNLYGKEDTNVASN